MALQRSLLLSAERVEEAHRLVGTPRDHDAVLSTPVTRVNALCVAIKLHKGHPAVVIHRCLLLLPSHETLNADSKTYLNIVLRNRSLREMYGQHIRGGSSAFRIMSTISKRYPENTPERAEFLYLCGNHWEGRSP